MATGTIASPCFALLQDIPLSPTHPSYDTLVAIEEGLPKLRDRPMLFVWGERDWCFTTEFLDEFLRRFPNAETLRLPDAGHYVFEDAVEPILRASRNFSRGTRRRWESRRNDPRNTRRAKHFRSKFSAVRRKTLGVFILDST